MASGQQARVQLARWLTGPAARPALVAAAQASAGRDPLAAAERLRRAMPTLAADQAAAALEQVDLRDLAERRYGIAAAGLLLTRDGLEQATRQQVAAHRADLLRRAGATRVVDLTGGLGFDSAAFLAAGLQVTAVERDEPTAILLAHNCPGARVLVGDATDPRVLADALSDLAPDDVVFVDPARRDASAPRDAHLRSRPERDPALWSPSWADVAALPHPRIAAKVAPSFTPPPPWRAEWVSVNRTVVECSLYSWEVFPQERRAAIVSGSRIEVLEATEGGDQEPGDELGSWVHEPDPAVLRAGALTTVLLRHPGLRRIGRESSWLTGEDEAAAVYLRGFRVIDELRGSPTEQRRQLDRAGVDRITVKSRDAHVGPSAVLRDLRRIEGPGHVVVVTRRRGRTVRILCEPERQRSS